MAFALPCLVFAAGWRYLGSGDTVPAELLPISVLREGNLDFNEFERSADLPYYFIRHGGRVLSAYPVVAGLLAVPVYAAASLFGADLFSRRQHLALAAAILITSGSVVFMFLALRRLSQSSRQALGFAYLYAFGTCVWSVASTALWQHTASLLFLSGALWLMFASTRPGAAGLLVGCAIASRPTDALLFAFAIPYLLLRRRTGRARFVLLMAIPITLVALYSKHYLGSWSLGQRFPTEGLGGDLRAGLAGVLISPSRGLLIFSPFLVAGVVGIVAAARRRSDDDVLLLTLAAGAIAVILLYAKWGMWWGGTSFGYRLILDVVPICLLLVVRAWSAIGRWKITRLAFGASISLAVYANALGALVYPSAFNQNINLETARLWDWKGSELVLCSRTIVGLPSKPPATVPPVWWTPEKNDDSIPGWLFRSPGDAPVHGPLEVSGWARSAMGDVDVQVVLDDGTAGTAERFAFPALVNVLPQLGDPSHAGFRVAFPPPLKKGWRAVAIELRSPAGTVRRLGPIRFWWQPDA